MDFASRCIRSRQAPPWLGCRAASEISSASLRVGAFAYTSHGGGSSQQSVTSAPLFQQLRTGAQYLEARILFIHRGNDVPGRVGAVRAIEHLLNRHLVLFPLAAVAPIIRGDLVMLHRIMLPTAETLELRFAVDMQKELRHPHSVVGQHFLEDVDLVVRPHPRLGGGELFDSLDQDTAVPTPVED